MNVCGSLMKAYKTKSKKGTGVLGKVRKAGALIQQFFPSGVLFSSVQALSHVRLFVTPGTAAHQASLSINNSQSLLKLMFIKSMMSSTISSSVVPFSCLQYLPASGSFEMSQFFASGSQSVGALASASVLPMNIQD